MTVLTRGACVLQTCRGVCGVRALSPKWLPGSHSSAFTRQTILPPLTALSRFFLSTRDATSAPFQFCSQLLTLVTSPREQVQPPRVGCCSIEVLLQQLGTDTRRAPKGAKTVCSSHEALQTSALAINVHKVGSGVHVRRGGVLPTLLTLVHLNPKETDHKNSTVHNIQLQDLVPDVQWVTSIDYWHCSVRRRA